MVKSVAIIPAYNEEVALGSIILRTLQYVDEVIIVNDGSDDKTVDVAKLAGAEIINHATNLGKGEALKSGFSAIGDADVVVTIDADGQHNPDEIPSLIKPIIEDGADLVNGSRYMNGPEEFLKCGSYIFVPIKQQDRTMGLIGLLTIIGIYPTICPSLHI